MEADAREPSAAARPGLLFVAAVVLAGANMRTVFASLPPLLEDARADLAMSATVAGLLTTLPVLCFGVLAPAAPALVRRVPIERLVAACAALTAIGAAARGVDGAATLFAGTIVAGAAVAVAQTALPSLLRLRFPAYAGSLTGAFSMALTVGAAAAAGAAAPLEDAFGESWRAALAAFAVPAALAAALWLTPAAGSATVVPRAEPLRLHRTARGWSLAAYFGLQSMAFYCGLTWLPAILEHEGYGEGEAGALLAWANALQLAPALAVPVVAARLRDQRPLLFALVALGAGALAGLLAAPAAAVVWMAVLGLGQGGSLGLALVLPVLRGAGAPAVAALTALTLSVGYLLCSIGPTLVGVAHDVSGGWTVPLLVMIAITLAELVPGWTATGRWTVGERDGGRDAV